MSDGMNVEQVLAQMRALAAKAQGQAPKVEQAPGFGDLLKQSIDQVNQTQQQAHTMAAQLETGEGEADLSQVMVELQKSSLSFQAMVQVRNKLVEAYKDVMSMPI
jgi:flagellar hook-basal body complex protein FliE